MYLIGPTEPISVIRSKDHYYIGFWNNIPRLGGTAALIIGRYFCLHRTRFYKFLNKLGRGTQAEFVAAYHYLIEVNFKRNPNSDAATDLYVQSVSTMLKEG